MSTEKIWENFHHQLLGFITVRVNNKNIAEDILQDVFVKIHLKSETLTEKTKLQSWLYQITRNAIVDFYRKKKLPISDDLAIDIPEEIDEKSLLDFCNCLIPFVNQLPEKDKEAILKTELGNLSQKEYAKNIGIPYSTLKSRIQRAKLKLKEAFVSCCKMKLDKNGKVISPENKCSC
ncbi:MAG: RNA polymerase sigma factor SigZ [Flavobacteriales bacterium]|nr:RNA polymerase sigma factor SigZ [Flavobacteriales bacterium]